MPEAVSIDGRILSAREATVSVFDRGFLYGDSVFEVLRTYGGRLTTLDEHLARLARSAERVAMEPPDLAGLASEARAAFAASGLSEAVVRIVLTRGVGLVRVSLDPDSATGSTRVILVYPVHAPPREAYEDGIALATVRLTRVVDGTEAVGAKVSNYLVSLLALREAKRKGASEALVVDGRGHVCEGATSNVFIVRGKQITTPPESAGILMGITRALVIESAKPAFSVVEADLVPEDVYRADEVFITSSIRELLSAVTVDGRTIGSGRPGPVARELHRRYVDRVSQR
jgi:branched-chain amino acid aminotransferase